MSEAVSELSVASMFRPISIDGTGVAVPATMQLSSDLDLRIGKPAGWLFRRTGVFSRPVCGAESQIDLGLAAARDAIAAAGIEAKDIDILLFAAAVPYQPIPATAPLLQQRLGIADGGCAAFDINATCLSFLSALDLLASMLATGRYRRGLVVSSEVASRALPWQTHPETAALFGDGAAAAVLSSGAGNAGIVAAAMETHPSGYDACRLAAGGTRFDFHEAPEEFARNSLFEMAGETLYRLTLKIFPPFLDRLLDSAGWDRKDVDVVVPHQASPGALAHLAKRSGFRRDVVIDIMRDRGNQIAASLPSALHAARATQRLSSGSKVLMLGTSAGVSLGGLALVA